MLSRVLRLRVNISTHSRRSAIRADMFPERGFGHQRANEYGRTHGFTLTELLIVIAIILLLTIMALPVVFAALKDRKSNDAVRTIHAVLAGARDRAIVSGKVRGVRLIRDTLDPWESSTLVYVGTPEPYSVGLVRTNGYTVEAEKKYTPSATDPHWELVDPGKDNVFNTPDDIPRVDAPLKSFPTGVRTRQAYIRFNGTGRLYHVGPPLSAVGFGVDDTLPLAELALDPTGPMPPPLGQGTSYQLFGPPSPLPQDNPTLLPEGLVIDLRFADIGYPAYFGPTHPFATDSLLNVPRSRWLPNQVPSEVFLKGSDATYGTPDDPPPAAWPPIDISFGPNGAVVGDGARNPLIHVWLGEHADKNGLRSHKLITINTRTATVQVIDEPVLAGPAPSFTGTTPPFFPEVYGLPEQLVGTSRLEALGVTY